jgi:hypothetical protein
VLSRVGFIESLLTLSKKDRPEHKPKDQREARVVDRKQFCPARHQLNQFSQNNTQQSAKNEAD